MINIDERLEKWKGLTFSVDDLEKIISFVTIRTTKNSPNSEVTIVCIKKYLDVLDSYLNEKELKKTQE
jgi:hypothetical protein